MPKPREKLGSHKLLLSSCIFPGARRGDSAINAHVEPALDPAGAGELNPSLSQEAGQQARNPRPNHTTLLLAAFMCGYNEWIPWRTPKKVSWTPGYFGISHLVLLFGFETYYCTVILLHSYTYSCRVTDILFYI